MNVCWKEKVECMTKHWRGSGRHDTQQGRKAMFVPLYKLKCCGGRVHTCVSAPRKTLFYGEFVKSKFVVSSIALAVSFSAVAPAQEKQIDWGSIGGGLPLPAHRGYHR
jgi:hypothetical protein